MSLQNKVWTSPLSEQPLYHEDELLGSIVNTNNNLNKKGGKNEKRLKQIKFSRT